MAGPTLILNTTQFGHADLLDELEAGANEVDDDDHYDDDHYDDDDDNDDDYYDHNPELVIVVLQIIHLCKASVDDYDNDNYDDN